MKLPNYLPQISQRFPNLYMNRDDGLVDLLRNELYKRTTIAELSRKLDVPENTLRGFFISNDKLSLRLIKDISAFLKIDVWNLVFKKAKFLSGGTYSNKIVLPKHMTNELAFFAGALRDGALSTYKYELVVSQLSKEWLDKRIRTCMEKLFGVKPKISFRTSDRCYYIKYRSAAAYAIIAVLLGWNKVMWKTPKIILNAPKNFQKHYIKGFWEAEGSDLKRGGLFIYQGWPSHKICPPLADIQKIIRKFKIESHFNKPQHGTNKPVHILYIPKAHKEKFYNIFEISKLR